MSARSTTSPPPGDDARWVLAQLLEAVPVAVRPLRQLHPFGSTFAFEDVTEVELLRPRVAVEIETDTIPVEIEGTGSFANRELRLRFFHPRVRGKRVTYHVEPVR